MSLSLDYSLILLISDNFIGLEMGNAKSTIESAPNTSASANTTESAHTTASTNTTESAPIITFINDTNKKCYFCGLDMPKHLLGQHNKDVHSVLRFEWVNGTPNIMTSNMKNLDNSLSKGLGQVPLAQLPLSTEPTVALSVSNVKFTSTQMAILPTEQMLSTFPPLPNTPTPVPIIPNPPHEPPDLTGNTPKFGLTYNEYKQANTDHLTNTTVYDMDISAESDTDSEHFIEGNLFDKSTVDGLVKAGNDVADTSGKANAEIVILPKRRSKKSRFSDINSNVAENMGNVQRTTTTTINTNTISASTTNFIEISKCSDIPKNRDKMDEKTKDIKTLTNNEIVKTDEEAKATIKSSRSYKRERPKLNAEVNDNFFDLILTAKVFSDSDTEYAEFPVESKFKYKGPKTIDCPQKRQRRTSSSSTVSSNGKTQQLRVTNADVKQFIDRNIGQESQISDK